LVALAIWQPACAQPEQNSFAPKASLFLVGGAANDVLRDLVRLAGGKAANVVVLPHASESPRSSGESMQNDFESLNVANCRVILPGAQEGLPPGTTAVYMTGGDQSRLKRLLKDPLLKDLSAFAGIIAGSSAGAMIASTDMIAGSMDSSTIRADRLRIAPGLNLLPGIVVDTHVGRRSRDTRSLAALALVPSAKMAVGIDEDTAVYIKDRKGTVFGAGHVRVYRRGPGFGSDISQKASGTTASVRNVVVSMYSAGDQFDL
jgi:cyanophycinase